jgi:hypothetical protein
MDLAFERVMGGTEEIAESECNMQMFCRRTLNREIIISGAQKMKRTQCMLLLIPMSHISRAKAYFRFDVDWKSFATHGTLDDLRIPKKKRNGAKKAGRQLGKSLQSLDPLNCTIGNDTAPVFVELTRAQLRDIDGDWYKSDPTLQSFNTSVNEAKTAYCPDWKQQKNLVRLAAEAVERAYFTKMEEQQQSR